MVNYLSGLPRDQKKRTLNPDISDAIKLAVSIIGEVKVLHEAFDQWRMTCVLFLTHMFLGELMNPGT
jgi:hypothetical protein